MRTKALVAALLATALLATACGNLNDDNGSAGGGGNDGGIDHPTGADALVLRISIGGGFVPVEYNLRALPAVSIFGDGRMIVEGPQIEIYPSPALPNLQVRQLSEEAVQAILRAAEAAGLLGPDATYDYPCVTDLPTTTFTVVAEGRTHMVSAYALGFEGEGMGGACDGVDTEARDQLSAFEQRLGDLASFVPEGSVGPETPYEPTEIRVYVLPFRGDPELPQPPLEWPLPQPLVAFGQPDPDLTDVRCGVVAGEDLAALMPLAQQANQLTPWTSGGEEYQLIFRPHLPDEHNC